MRSDPNYGTVLSSRDEATNDVTTVTLAAAAQTKHVIDQVIFGFTDDPATAKLLTITEDGTVVHKQVVTRGGSQEVPLRRPYVSAENVDVVISLEAGGAGIDSHLTVFYR